MTSGVQLFNPSRLSDEELEGTFVGRRALVDRWIHDLVTDAAHRSSRHWLLIGLRGLGKSHLVELVARRLRREHDWVVVRLPEEHYQIASLSDFLEQLVARATDALSPFSAEPDASKVEALAIDWLHRQSRGSMLVVVENLGMFLAKLTTRDQRRLRELLMRDAPFVMLATAPGPVAAATSHEAPFYDFFQTVVLDELSREEIKDLVTTRMHRDGPQELTGHQDAVLGRFDALYHFAGGNPRLALALYGVLRDGVTETFHNHLLDLLDRITPYYQARLTDVSPQMARVLTEMAIAEGALTPAEIARRTRLKTNQVTANVAKLVEERLIRPAGRPDRRRRYYEVIDRLFRIWLQMREDRGGRTRLRFLAEFFAAIYGAQRDLLWRLTEDLGKRFWDDAAAGRTGRAGDAARTLDHLGRALGISDDEVAMVVLDRDAAEAASDDELANLERQYAASETDGVRHVVAVRVVEAWDERGLAERAFPILSDAALRHGPVPPRLGCWYGALALELGRDQRAVWQVTVDPTSRVGQILAATRSGEQLDPEVMTGITARDLPAVLRLLTAAHYPAVLAAEALASDPSASLLRSVYAGHPVVPWDPLLPRFPSAVFALLHRFHPADLASRILRRLVTRGYRGVPAAFGTIDVLCIAVVHAPRDARELARWLVDECPAWPQLRDALIVSRLPGVLDVYALLREVGWFTEDLSPFAAALGVRRNPDREAALAALHPEERDAVRIVLSSERPGE